MSLLTDREIEQLSEGIAIDDFNHDLARRVEAAVLQKLETVSVAPVAWLDEEFDMAYTALELAGEPTDPTMFPALYPPEAIAAARVQALEDAAKVCAKQLSPLESADRSWNAATRSCIRHINNLTDSYETSLQTPSSDQSKAQGLP